MTEAIFKGASGKLHRFVATPPDTEFAAVPAVYAFAKPNGRQWIPVFLSRTANLAARMDPAGTRELEAAGIIDSKFGAVTLFRRVGGTEAGRACLRFFKHVETPKFRVSGWSCLGDDLPARRAAIGCMLNRLILLSAGNDAKLAELFAHAEIRRSDCATSGAPVLSADWVLGADNPRLRGTL